VSSVLHVVWQAFSQIDRCRGIKGRSTAPRCCKHRTILMPCTRIVLRFRREQKYQEKLALKKAQRRAAESEQEKAERKRKAKMDGTAAHFG